MTWGPWIEHDGKGCPAPIGTRVQGIRRSGSCSEWDVWQRLMPGQGAVRVNSINPAISSWHWAQPRNRWVDTQNDVMRYRNRYPDALTTLRDIAANPERELADAQ